MNQKTCSRCAVSKPLTEFHRRRHYVRSGVRAACKECTATASARSPRSPADSTKALIRARTRRAIVDGVLKRERCVVCGDSDVQPHHLDYSRGNASHLLIEWLCVEHHRRRHGFHPWTRQLDLCIDQQTVSQHQIHQEVR